MDELFESKNCIPSKKLTQKDIEDQLIKNFNRHYKTNKAPFIINIETNWFKSHGEILTNALVKFVDILTNFNSESATNKDIYFVTLSKIIEWIQNPIPIEYLNNRWYWDCNDVEFDYDSECIKKLVPRNLKESEDEENLLKNKNSTLKLGLESEILFQNGVLTGVIVCFILSIIFIIFYDKYC